VSYTTPTVSDGLTPSIASSILRRAEDGIRSCYQSERVKDLSLQGELTLQVLVNQEGRVMATKKTSSTLKNGAMESCVVAHVKRLRFPDPQDDLTVTINQSITFSPSEERPEGQ